MSLNPFRTRRAQGDHGAVLVVVAITMTSLISMAAFAVNLGSISLKRRDLQADADAIALDLGRALDGRATTAYGTYPLTSAGDWEAAVNASRDRNNFPVSGTETDGIRDLEIIPGCLVQTPATTAVDPTCPIADAVKVIAIDDVSEFFKFTNGTTSRSAIGRADGEPEACFSIGSFALGLSSAESALLNPLISDALNLGVLSYQGLATSSITFDDLLGTSVFSTLSIGTLDQLAAGDIALDDFYLAVAEVLVAQGDTVNATLLQTIAAQVGSLPAINIADLVGIAPSSEAALFTEFNVLDLVAGSAFLANGTNFLAVPAMTVSVGTLTTLTSTLSIIERQQIGCGPVGASARTSQIALDVTGTLAGLPNLLGVLSVSAGLNLSLDTAEAVGIIDRIVCANPPTAVTPAELDVAVTTALLQAGVTIPVTITGNLGLVSISITLDVRLETNVPISSQLADFVIPPDAYNMPEETGTGTIGLAGLAVQQLNVVVTAKLFGVPVALPVPLASILGPLTTDIINPLVTDIDSLLLGPLTDLLGLNVAGADVTALPPLPTETCGNGSPMLVG